MHVAVIINPAAGRRPSLETARRRADLASAVLRASGVTADVFVSERPGHATDLARAAAAHGAAAVFAWGGDGTVNEVGRALAFTDVSLAIVPAGSGNGLALALGIPRDPAAALRRGIGTCSRRIDVGEIDKRLFLNIAGIGFDAQIAERFGRPGGRRGMRGYAAAVAGELFRYRGQSCRVTIQGCVREHTALLLVVANGPQWGNGAMIAPQARLDDGLLDLVTVAPRSPWRAAWQIQHLFRGTLGRVPGVTTQRITDLEIAAEAPVTYHVDGQPARCETGILRVRVHPGALSVRV